jgi:hypothetical protein
VYTEPGAREADGEVLARPGVVRHRRVVEASAGGAPSCRRRRRGRVLARLRRVQLPSAAGELAAARVA